MKEQFIKIFSWMKDLGLSSEELVVFAVIYAYTGFRGSFDGDPGWLAQWARVGAADVYGLLEGLSGKGLIIKARGPYGNACYKSCVSGAAPAGRSGAARYNINNNIIEYSIEKEIDKIPIEYSIDPIKKNNDTDITTDNTGSKKAFSDTNDTKSAPSAPKSFIMDKAHTDELMKLLGPYENVCEAPYELLEEKMRILLQREAEKEAG